MNKNDDDLEVLFTPPDLYKNISTCSYCLGNLFKRVHDVVRGKRSEENGTVLNTMFSVILSSPFCRYIVRLYKMAVVEKLLYVFRVCVNCHYRCRKATALR